MGNEALILRDAARAAATVREFSQLGITSRCAQLIATVWPEDPTPGQETVAKLLAGDYDWLVLTSATTVHAMAQLLGERKLPQNLKLAVVGNKTAAVAKDLLGLDVKFTASIQSAAGMLAEWTPEAGAVICYPHGDLASDTLSTGLARLPVFVDETIAYRTVDAPAQNQVHAPAAPTRLQTVEPQQIQGLLHELDLILFTAPSIAGRFAELAGTDVPDSCKTLAIGGPTAKAMKRLGLRVDAQALHPDPEHLAAQAAALLGIKI